MNRPTDNGSVLVVSLLILLVMTMLGVTSMSNTTLEERMAGSQRNQDLAFQAAESALKDGEAFAESLVTTGGFNGTNGQYAADDTIPDLFAASTWTSANSRAYSGTIPGVATQPRYIVQLIGEMTDDSATGSLAIGRYGEESAGGAATAFRVTARGTGGSDDAVVILQSYYGKVF